MWRPNALYRPDAKSAEKIIPRKTTPAARNARTAPPKRELRTWTSILATPGHACTESAVSTAKGNTKTPAILRTRDDAPNERQDTTKHWIYINTYNEGGHRAAAAERLTNIDLPRNTPTVFLGDWKLHHELWSRADKNGSRRSRNFVEWMMEAEAGPQCVLINKKGEVTFTPHNATSSSSVIDLMFVNGRAINDDIIQEWTIDRSMSYGSDHHGIRWTTDNGREEIDNVTGTRYNMKDVDPKKWSSAFREELDNRRPAIDAILDPDMQVSNEQLEATATALTEAMQAATARVAKPKRQSKMAKPWWNDELRTAVNNLSNAQLELKTVDVLID
ncbi:unnamed protein product [Mycena citricolor]|uniref:Endonuclease/exonuclease/phosphatase domain-containing protein n=1 Tax=Mycena citricolor TaxID=2018698 RepID=A0AAD2JVS7_9AGAR|nr:unnamed protein product [Mycena citricolor]